jgi:hypothetical protein
MYHDVKFVVYFFKHAKKLLCSLILTKTDNHGKNKQD